MDIVGQLKRTKKGNKYILVLMDYATKWPDAFPLGNILTETIVECLVEVTARLGVPQELLTDNGSNFMSKVMQRFCMLTGVKQKKIFPYQPQMDGMMERFNATLKRLLRKLVATQRQSGTSVCRMYYGHTEEQYTRPQVSPRTSYYLGRK